MSGLSTLLAQLLWSFQQTLCQPPNCLQFPLLGEQVYWSMPIASYSSLRKTDQETLRYTLRFFNKSWLNPSALLVTTIVPLFWAVLFLFFLVSLFFWSEILNSGGSTIDRRSEWWGGRCLSSRWRGGGSGGPTRDKGAGVGTRSCQFHFFSLMLLRVYLPFFSFSLLLLITFSSSVFGRQPANPPGCRWGRMAERPKRQHWKDR